MIEHKTKVVPMMVPESTDPYVFDTTTQEFVKIELTEMEIDRLKRYTEIWNKGTQSES